MNASDIDDVVAIEREAQGHPWDAKVFAEELEREWARLVVLRCEGRVVAYCNYWLVHDEVHLLNIATDASVRRQGCGTLLMQHLLQVARERDSRYVTLEVRVSNAAAIAMYDRHGFAQVGVRPGYYADNREDALVMVLELPPKSP